jgi:hypothetical protein
MMLRADAIKPGGTRLAIWRRRAVRVRSLAPIAGRRRAGKRTSRVGRERGQPFIDRLGELYPHGRFEVRRFRPNIVVTQTSDERSFVENAWVGQTLAIGGDVRLGVTGLCGRCVMTTLAQGDVPKDPEILRTAARHNQAHVGFYVAVVRGGTIRRRDVVRPVA